MPDQVLSVVIGTYNQEKSLKMVLESFTNQTLAPELYEVIVIDSNSEDNTTGMIEALSPEYDLKYFKVENRGKTAARNQGIKNAKGDIILLTDADMLADASLLEEHISFHNTHKKCCAEGLTYNLKILEKLSAPENLSPYIKEKVRPGQKLKWAYFLSGNLSAPKEILLKAGLFDERFVSYGWEDIELGYRLSKMSIPLLYLPAAVNYHYHAVSPEDMLLRKYLTGVSAALFYLKHKNHEIKYYLGLNPLANSAYKVLKRLPKLQNSIQKRAARSAFCRYLAEEYNYRAGMEKKLNEEGYKL